MHILIAQLPTVLGLSSPGGTMFQRVAILAGHLNEANPFTLSIAFGVLAVIALSEWINARVPGALIGLGMATTAVALMGLESRGVTVLGTVSGALPSFAIPDISAGRLTNLVPLTLIIAIAREKACRHRYREQIGDPAQTKNSADNEHETNHKR